MWYKTKKYLVVFCKQEINSLHVYYLISYVIFGLFIFFSFFMQNWILWYTSKYFFQQVLNFFSIICVFKKLLELSDVFCVFFKDISSLTIYRISMKKKIELFKHFLYDSPDRQFLSMNIEIVSKGDETKTCVNKSFDVIITKFLYVFYLHLQFKISKHLPSNTKELWTFRLNSLLNIIIKNCSCLLKHKLWLVRSAQGWTTLPIKYIPASMFSSVTLFLLVEAS